MRFFETVPRARGPAGPTFRVPYCIPSTPPYFFLSFPFHVSSSKHRFPEDNEFKEGCEICKATPRGTAKGAPSRNYNDERKSRAARRARVKTRNRPESMYLPAVGTIRGSNFTGRLAANARRFRRTVKSAEGKGVACATAERFGGGPCHAF